MKQLDYFIGLDLGQPHEFTALAVLERSTEAAAALRREDWRYALRHLHRFPIGTPYTEIVPAVMNLAGSLVGAPIIVDQTGVGRAVIEMLRTAPRTGSLVPVTITAGQEVVQQEDWSFAVPKKDLASHVQVVLQQRRLKVARMLPESALLVKELQTFRVKTTINVTDAMAWREGAHDDLVLAVALACWWAERSYPWGPDAFAGGGSSLLERLPEGVFAFDEEQPRWLEKTF